VSLNCNPNCNPSLAISAGVSSCCATLSAPVLARRRLDLLPPAAGEWPGPRNRRRTQRRQSPPRTPRIRSPPSSGPSGRCVTACWTPRASSTAAMRQTYRRRAGPLPSDPRRSADAARTIRQPGPVSSFRRSASVLTNRSSTVRVRGKGVAWGSSPETDPGLGRGDRGSEA